MLPGVGGRPCHVHLAWWGIVQCLLLCGEACEAGMEG